MLEIIPLEAYGWGVAAVLGVMTLFWTLSLRINDVSIVDMIWGPAFAIAAWVYASVGLGLDEAVSAPWRLLPLILVTVWGLRLGLHIFWRHDGEDRRYQKMRRKVGPFFRWRALLTVFLLQGVLVAIISWPLLFAVTAPRPERLTWLDFLGVGFWLVGFFFEAVGDWQLTKFKADPGNRGQVLDTGLWRYTRHPNYFGDACLWWGFGVMSLNAEGSLSLPVLSVVSVGLMTFFLLKVSGVTLLERDIAERRPAYRRYIERTSAFLPRPPKSIPDS